MLYSAVQNYHRGTSRTNRIESMVCLIRCIIGEFVDVEGGLRDMSFC